MCRSLHITSGQFRITLDRVHLTRHRRVDTLRDLLPFAGRLVFLLSFPIVLVFFRLVVLLMLLALYLLASACRFWVWLRARAVISFLRRTIGQLGVVYVQL